MLKRGPGMELSVGRVAANELAPARAIMSESLDLSRLTIISDGVMGINVRSTI